MKIGKFEVVDATRPLRIKIGRSDVVRGKAVTPAGCAAARAWKRQTHCSQALVHLSRTYVIRGGKAVRYMTPPPVRTEIVAFDRGAPFQTGEYTFPPPYRAKKLTGKGQGSNTNRSKPKHKQKSRQPYHTVTGVRPNARTEYAVGR